MPSHDVAPDPVPESALQQGLHGAGIQADPTAQRLTDFRTAHPWLAAAGDVLSGGATDPNAHLGPTDLGMAAIPLMGVPLKGVYSRLEENLLPALKATESPSRIKTLVGSMASPEEADLRGFNEWIASHPQNARLTKESVQQFLQQHPMPQVSEILFGAGRLDHDIEQLRYVRDTQGLTAAQDRQLRDLEDANEYRAPRWDREDVNLPGGSGYREYVFTLPQRMPENLVKPQTPVIRFAEPREGRLMSTANPSKIGNGPHPVTVHEYEFAQNPGDLGKQSLDLAGKGYGQGRIVEWPEGVGPRPRTTAEALARQLDDKDWKEWPTNRFQINDHIVQNSWHPSLDEAKAYLLKSHTQNAWEKADQANNNAIRSLNYTSGHWSDITNPVAHLRMDDRVTVHGEPAALVQEIQSDWAQQGRDMGFRGNVSDAQRRASEKALADAQAAEEQSRDRMNAAQMDAGLHPNGDDVSSGRRFANEYLRYMNGQKTDPFLDTLPQRNLQELGNAVSEHHLRLAELDNAANLYRRLLDNNAGVPDMPFKDTGWQKLAFNRALVDAVDRDKEWLLWTTGDQQAERYGNLLKNITAVTWDPEEGRLLVKNGPHDSHDFDAENEAEVEKIIGKAATQRLLASRGEERLLNGRTGYHVYQLDTSKEPLKITSAGMVQQYDTNLVNYAKKLGKQHGAAVDQVSVKVPQKEPRYVRNQTGPFEWRLLDTHTDEHVPGVSVPPNWHGDETIDKMNESVGQGPTQKVWGLKLTPELKQAIKTKGLPLFGLGGMGLMASHQQSQ